ESNPQPPVLETGALPIELLAYINLVIWSFGNLVIAHSDLAIARNNQLTRRPNNQIPLLTIYMHREIAKQPAELLSLPPIRRLLLVLRRAVVPALALLARHRDDVSHGSLPDRYSRISVIVPEPTVRPPSRMAKRPPFSSATGDISSPVIVVLSPGMTIST